jgi:hypothetical protein
MSNIKNVNYNTLSSQPSITKKKPKCELALQASSAPHVISQEIEKNAILVSYIRNFKATNNPASHKWLTLVILATSEAGIGRICGSRSAQATKSKSYLKNAQHKKESVEWLKW